MKKCVLLLSAFLVCLLLVCCTRIKERYPEGKDTVESFGDGTYQILRGNFEDKECVGLSFSPAGVHLIPKVKTYQEKNGCIYLVGVDEGYYINGKKVSWKFAVYAVIDLSNNHIQICAIPEIDSEYNFRISQAALDTGLITIIGDYSVFSQKDRLVLDAMKG
ncbi:MAG: hypothetical protein E7454_04510 [Ruminococcaceae bacterium]|nr:hypothetical protein [Oscillospiraceae bacterium]